MIVKTVPIEKKSTYISCSVGYVFVLYFYSFEKHWIEDKLRINFPMLYINVLDFITSKQLINAWHN